MSIVLVGYRGSGKTTVGRILADRMWRPFVDLDELIVRRAGMSISEIFRQFGEEHFRGLETQSLAEACAMEDAVIALGGGALGREENRRMLQAGGHRVIYLRCDPVELLRRIEADPGTAGARPSLTALGGGIEEIRQVLAERQPIYQQAMHAELDVTHLTPDEAVVHIVRLI